MKLDEIIRNSDLNINDEMNNYIDELCDKLRNDTIVYNEIKKLNLSRKEVRDNIAKLNDFRLDFNYCKNCPGIENCNKATPHLKAKISKENRFIDLKFEPCDALINKVRIDNQYLFSDFPNDWKMNNIQSLDLNKNRRELIKDYSLFLKKEYNKWFYLGGGTGVGKSFILVTFANTFVKNNLGQVAIINCPNRFKELSTLSRTDKDEFDDLMNKIFQVPFLVLDDFGNEYKSEYVRDNITIPILIERQRRGLITFFSSEFSIDEIGKMYSIGDYSGPIRGRQIEKTLLKMCKYYDLDGIAIYH